MYTKLQRKLPETTLARYHRWIYEHNKPESVVSLREWIIQEAEFQTIASETVHGITGTSGNAEAIRPVSGAMKQRTFYGGIQDNMNKMSSERLCGICRKQHAIWRCEEFLESSVPNRWELAKRNRLCYRCLRGGHLGKSCLKTRKCGIDGCIDVHNRLLHGYGSQTVNGWEQRRERQYSSCPIMEGNSATTMVAQDYAKTNFILTADSSCNFEKWQPPGKSKCITG